MGPIQHPPLFMPADLNPNEQSVQSVKSVQPGHWHDVRGQDAAVQDGGPNARALPFKPLSLWQVSLSKRAVLAGDVLAIALAFGLATLLNVGLTGLAFVQTQLWFSTQDPQRYASWFSLSALGLGIFLFRYQHYVNRRPFWDELSDVLWTVGCLALLDMTLVAVTRWNASRLWWVLSMTTPRRWGKGKRQSEASQPGAESRSTVVKCFSIIAAPKATAAIGTSMPSV